MHATQLRGASATAIGRPALHRDVTHKLRHSSDQNSLWPTSTNAICGPTRARRRRYDDTQVHAA